MINDKLGISYSSFIIPHLEPVPFPSSFPIVYEDGGPYDVEVTVTDTLKGEFIGD
ncbi:MAG: hypothetical protein IH977_09910 [Nitrospinae bacterium]|nr:hypothetical protein [Nitrospinota bacterium]